MLLLHGVHVVHNMESNYYGYIVDIEEEYIYLGKLTAHNWREMNPEEKARYPGYSHTGSYLRRQRFRMTPGLSANIHRYFRIGRYVKITAEDRQVKAVGAAIPEKRPDLDAL